MIINVITQCGCTVPQYNKDIIAPGDSDYIKVRYDRKIRISAKTIKVNQFRRWYQIDNFCECDLIWIGSDTLRILVVY